MSFDQKADPPANHPVSPERARELIGGELGHVYREIVRNCMAPIFWTEPAEGGKLEVKTNGTLTFANTSLGVIGITAHHVVAGFLKAGGARCHIMNRAVDLDVIDASEALDLATLRLPTSLTELGKDIAPISLGRAHDEPTEGRGILLGGYPGSERIVSPGQIDWGMFVAVGIARRVNYRQITWSPEREHHVGPAAMPILPPHQELGGISGGPLIAIFEKAGSLMSYQSLAGIIIEADADKELVIAQRTDSVRADGTIGPLVY